MTQHTATPWKVSVIAPLNITDNNGHLIADCCSAWSVGSNREANAAHIVRCVNAHDDLVKALEAMLNGLRIPNSQVDHNAEREEACSLARADQRK